MDTEDNNTVNTAELMPNVPGNIKGRVGFGVYDKDAVDYFSIGTMALGDTAIFKFIVDNNTVNFKLERIAGGTVLEKDFGDIMGMKTDTVIINPEGIYVIRSSSAACSTYSIALSGSLSYVRINGTDLIGLVSAAKSIDIRNSAATNNSSLCAPCVTICPIFEVPLGNQFTIIPKGN